MKPKRIILIRHGESEGNVNRKIYENVPDYQLALSQKGKEQAIQCGKDLKKIIGTKSCFFYVSPFKRTRETFQLISRSFDKNQIQKREDPRIREQEWGHLKTVKELKLIDAERAAYGNFFYRIPDGESCADVYDRMSSFFNCLHRNFDKDVQFLDENQIRFRAEVFDSNRKNLFSTDLILRRSEAEKRVKELAIQARKNLT